MQRAAAPNAMTDQSKFGAKLPYETPSLTVFGSVRELTGGSSTGSTDGGSGMGPPQPSDPAFKENVARIGEHSTGFGLYLFDYKPEFRGAFGHGRQFGVMADEIERIVPEAVTVGCDGYRRVDYGLIGVTRH